MDETENQINDMEHKEAKNNQSEQQEEKRIKKKKRLCKQPLGQHLSNPRGARNRRERARNWKSI